MTAVSREDRGVALLKELRTRLVELEARVKCGLSAAELAQALRGITDTVSLELGRCYARTAMQAQESADEQLVREALEAVRSALRMRDPGLGGGAAPRRLSVAREALDRIAG